MIPFETFIHAFIAFGSIAVLYFSRFCLRKHAKLKGKEIALLRPDLGALKFTYNFWQTLIALALFFLVVVVSNAFGIQDMRIVFLTIPLFSGLAIFDGIFALITNVYPATSKSNWDQFVYDETKTLRWIAYTQIGFAVLWIAVGMQLFQIFWVVTTKNVVLPGL